MQLFLAVSLERLDPIILISIYISVKISIHFGGHHLFQTIFGRHFSLLFYPCRHFNSFHFKKLRRWHLGHHQFIFFKWEKRSRLATEPVMIFKPGLYFIKFKYFACLFLVNFTFLYFILSLCLFFFVLYSYLLTPCFDRFYLIEFFSYLSHVLPGHLRFSFLRKPS